MLVDFPTISTVPETWGRDTAYVISGPKMGKQKWASVFTFVCMFLLQFVKSQTLDGLSWTAGLQDTSADKHHLSINNTYNIRALAARAGPLQYSYNLYFAAVSVYSVLKHTGQWNGHMEYPRLGSEGRLLLLPLPLPLLLLLLLIIIIIMIIVLNSNQNTTNNHGKSDVRALAARAGPTSGLWAAASSTAW